MLVVDMLVELFFVLFLSDRYEWLHAFLLCLLLTSILGFFEFLVSFEDNFVVLVVSMHVQGDHLIWIRRHPLVWHPEDLSM